MDSLPAKGRAVQSCTREGTVRYCSGHCGRYRSEPLGHAAQRLQASAHVQSWMWMRCLPVTTARLSGPASPSARSTTRRSTRSTTTRSCSQPRTNSCRTLGDCSRAPAPAGPASAQRPRVCFVLSSFAANSANKVLRSVTVSD